jgi:ABC-type branched-subunit amino acid transport system ATPase component
MVSVIHAAQNHDKSLRADGLVVDGISVRYGGHLAVDKVSLDAPVGRLTGLIGPNGAGKTTTFNACSGLVRPSGRVELFGRDITRLPPHARARRGLGRTFQRMELFDSLTVVENVCLGREASYAGPFPWSHLRSSSSERRRIRAAAEEALEVCGLGDVRNRQPIDLSTGQRRLVELARVIAGEFRILLLDEPSSGLDVTETRRFGQVLRSLVDERHVGILCVEHDMSLVMTVCDYIYVLDFGEPIFEGNPAQVAESDLVRAAYLGSDDLESAVGDKSE